MRKNIRKKLITMFVVSLALCFSLFLFLNNNSGKKGTLADSSQNVTQTFGTQSTFGTGAPGGVPLFSSKNSATTFKYGHHDKYATEKEGIVVSLAKEDVLTYNKVIDLNDKERGDNIVSLFPTPSIIGTADAYILYITFTDIYNPNNFVKIRAYDAYGIDVNGGMDHLYTTATFDDVNYAGCDHLAGNLIRKNNSYGTPGLVSLAGLEYNNGKVGDRSIQVAWDYNKKIVYGTPYSTSEVLPPVVAELSNTDFYDDIWNGFTSGKVYVSFQAKLYNTESFNFVITNINGDDLSIASFIDDEAPTLDINLEEFGGETELNGVKDIRFKLPNATAFDTVDKNVNISKAVYYQNGNDREPVIFANNSFVPKFYGKYYIVYTATDDFGNTANKELEVNVSTAQKDLSIVLYNERDNFIVGEKALLADDISFNGNIGTTDLDIKAVLIGNEDVNYTIDNKTHIFKPERTGEYKIIYKFSDSVRDRIIERKVTVNGNANPVLEENVILPHYVIKSAKYSISPAVCSDYKTNEKVNVLSDIYVKKDFGNSETKVTNGLYVVDANEAVKFIFKVGDYVVYESENIPVVDIGYGVNEQCYNYFVSTQNAETFADENGIYFNFNKNNKFEFINSVQIVNFVFEFGLYAGVSRKGADRINLYLVDELDSENFIKISYSYYSAEKSAVQINDNGIEYRINGSFASATNLFRLGYSSENNKIYFGNDISLVVKDFNGFTGNKAYLYMEVEGVKSNTTLSLYRLNNQGLCNLADGDITEPEILYKENNGDRSKGTVITIPVAYAYDVLDPYVELTLNVKKGDSYVVDKNGLTLKDIRKTDIEYSYLIQDYAAYTTTYTAIDGTGKSICQNIKSYSNTGVDYEAPVIKINGSIIKTAKLGQKVNLPSVSVSDNLNDDLIAYIYIEKPNGSCDDYTGKNSFITTQKGKYKICFYAIDRFGNTDLKMFYINVQ